MPKKIDIEVPQSSPVWEAIETHLRARMQELLQDMLMEEADELLARARYQRRAPDNPKVYRNGFGKPRRVSTTMGTLTVQRPRIRGLEERFESLILPFFTRRTKEVGELLPELYLHGLAHGDFELALRGLLGEGAPLSGASIARLKADWQQQYEVWASRSLADLDIVYCWADGLYVKAGLEGGKAALLVIIGATRTGEKVLLSVTSGHRESTESWARVLRDLKARGVAAIRLMIADGHLGIWSALAQIYPECAEQRCWNHKIVNVLDEVPPTKQAPVKQWLRKMMYAETREQCEELRDKCIKQHRAKYPKTMAALERDWDRMVTYYEFPAEHWIHLRTTNVVESPFAAVRLRTNAGKRYKKTENATALIWKLLMVAAKSFRRLNAPHLLAVVATGGKYVNGKPVHAAVERIAA